MNYFKAQTAAMGLVMRKFTTWLTIALIFIVPWEDSMSVIALGSLARLMGFVVAIFWIATILVEGKIRKPHFFHVIVLLFFLWNFISVAWSIDIEYSIQRIKTYSQMFLLMLIFWDVNENSETLTKELQAFIFGGYVLIGSTFYNYINGITSVSFEARYSTPGVNAVDLALTLILGMPIALQLFFSASHHGTGFVLRIINLAYIPLAAFATILSGSRTSLIAVIPFGIYLLTTQQIKFGRKIIVTGILLISLIAMMPFIPESITARLSTLGTSIGTGDIGGRVELWRQAILVFSEHPIGGLGGGALESAIGSVGHNTFVSVLAETGAIGFGFFMIMLALVIFQAINIQNGNAGLWVSIFLTWAIGVCSLSWEVKKITWLLLNFIVIEGSFSIQQIHIWQTNGNYPSVINQLLRSRDDENRSEENYKAAEPL